ncbi:MAG: PLP-dependent transferase [Clostridia bacterium]|nr:PLP-dependent transferase [Clostridia bacterium]
MRFETKVIHGGIDGDVTTGAVSVPIYQTSTYKFIGLEENKGYDYSRAGNPTRSAVEKLIAEMEGGSAGFAFASGMAAITAVLMLFKSGDKILISDNIYGGTYRVLDQIFNHFEIHYEMVDTNNLKEIEILLGPTVKAIIVETPTNPLLGITDIEKLTQFAKENNLLTIIDNTFMTPYLQRPLEMGADIVLHSGTKYLGGHSDLLAGLVVVKEQKLADQLYLIQKSTGGILSPNDSWLLIRGIKTLAVRMDRHQVNSAGLVEFLQAHPLVEHVYYPGLLSHSGHDIQKRQARGFGAIISFVINEKVDIKKFVKAFDIITFGESLGGVESLLTHPETMTHGAIPYELRKKMGISRNLFRLSVGIENVDDLILDIKNAFEAASGQHNYGV